MNKNDVTDQPNTQLLKRKLDKPKQITSKTNDPF